MPRSRLRLPPHFGIARAGRCSGRTMRLRAPLPDLAARRGPLKLSATNTISSLRNETEVFRRSRRHTGTKSGNLDSRPPDRRRKTARRNTAVVGGGPLTWAHASLRVPLPDLRRHLRTEPPDGGFRRPRGLPRRPRRHSETSLHGRGRDRRRGARPAREWRWGRLLRRRMLRLTHGLFSGTLQVCPAHPGSSGARDEPTAPQTGPGRPQAAMNSRRIRSPAATPRSARAVTAGALQSASASSP